eukprot:5145461-Pyramimonas_sp.AAC.1
MFRQKRSRWHSISRYAQNVKSCIDYITARGGKSWTDARDLEKDASWAGLLDDKEVCKAGGRPTKRRKGGKSLISRLVLHVELELFHTCNIWKSPLRKNPTLFGLVAGTTLI